MTIRATTCVTAIFAVVIATLAAPAAHAADTTPPTFGTVPDVTINATGPDGAVASYPIPAAYDDVDGMTVVACTPPAGRFPLGRTTVTCTTSDTARNTTSVSFAVVVVDRTPPELSPVSDVTIEATSPAGAVATWPIPTATDLVSGTLPVTCTPASGTQMLLGRHMVTCLAIDAAKIANARSFYVHVVDTTPPSMSVPDRVTIAAETTTGTLVHPMDFVTVADLVDTSPAASCSPAAGEFPIGDTTVTCTATDRPGNTSSTSFVVEVRDAGAPLFGPLDGVEAEATSAGGAAVALPAVSAIDAIDGDVPAGCLPASGSTFPIGVTTVTCTAADSAGNEATATFIVAVVDTSPPVLTLPTSIDATVGEQVVWPASATDLVDGPRPIDCDTRQATTFPVGSTTVTCMSRDRVGNVASRSFQVTVTGAAELPSEPGAADARPFDTVAPRFIDLPRRIDIDAVRSNRGRLDLRLRAVDATDGPRPVRCSPRSGRWLTLGVHRVTCTASDSQGNVARATITVHVRYVWLGLVGRTGIREVRAGRTVPISFVLSGRHGHAVVRSARTVPVRCGRLGPIGRVERVRTGSYYLRSKRAWSLEVPTRASWAGSCRRLDVTLRDGTTRSVRLRIR